MKVLVISSLYPSNTDPLSGIFVGAQVQELQKGGCQVKVISPKPLAPFPLNLLSRKWAGWHHTPTFAEVKGISVHYPRYLSLPRSWAFASSGERMYRRIKPLVAELMEEFTPDLIQAHTALPDGYAALRLSEDFSIPFLVTIHGADLQKTIHFSSRCRAAVAEVITHSSATVLVSRKLKKIARELVGNGPRLEVIANGIDPSSIRSHAREVPGTERKTKILLSVSNLVPTKGVDLNLRALKRLLPKYPNLKYLVIGDGLERATLERLAGQLGLSSQVEFLGQLPRESVLEAMADCDIFSLPSWQEGFGIVYLEAMAHGKPVLGCRGEGIEDFVVDRETGYLVNPKDLNHLTEVLDRILDRPQERGEVGNKAREMVLENYTWEVNARKTIQLYQEVMEGHS